MAQTIQDIFTSEKYPIEKFNNMEFGEGLSMLSSFYFNLKHAKHFPERVHIQGHETVMKNLILEVFPDDNGFFLYGNSVDNVPIRIYFDNSEHFYFSHMKDLIQILKDNIPTHKRVLY